MTIANRNGGRRYTAPGAGNDVINVGVVDWEDAESEGNIVEQPKADPGWHQIAKDLWEAAGRSGQRLYYEPSDWRAAYLLCEQITRELEPRFVGFKKVQAGETRSGLPIMEDVEHYERMPITAGSLSALLKGFEKLMFTETDRRKARVEIERGAVLENAPEQSEIAATRLELLEGGRSA